MAERIINLDIQAFRGIPGNFAMDLPGGVSWIALGDNGTGKSSIADAIEWYFSGQIEFLRKEGRTDAIRHSGALQSLQTVVNIDTDGSLGGTITVDTLPHQSVLNVGQSELFMLRGRSLAQFVDKTKGQKWQALAELLGLDEINELRLHLQYARNTLETQTKNLKDVFTEKESFLGFVVTEVSESGIIETFKKTCHEAAVQAPKSLTEALTMEWIKAIVPEGTVDPRAAKLQTALVDLKEIAGQSAPLDPIESWNDFVRTGMVQVLPLRLFKAADSFSVSASEDLQHCPLCGQPVDWAALRQKISSTLQEMQSAEQDLNEARQLIRQFVRKLRSSDQKRSDIVGVARLQGIDLNKMPSDPYDGFEENIEAVTTISRSAAELHQRAIANWDTDAIKHLQVAMPPVASTQEQALVDVGILHARALQWQAARQAYEKSHCAFNISDNIFFNYQEHQHNYFKKIVHQISQRTAQIYEFLHPSEGVEDLTVETIGEKGAELSVNYFGKKEIPPHRVLSESHLNSLGLALFLAMAETFNEELGFIVLDDVISSFDREHRGRLAELLVKEFWETQLIVLTHDEQFFNRISVLAPSWTTEQFTSWSYECGPRTRRYDGDKLLSEASEELSIGNRVGAAQKGRRALEEFLQEACEELEALLPFRRGQKNDQRMADEVMKGLRRTLRGLAKPMYDKLRPLLQSLEADLQASLNVESHASQGGTSNQEIADYLARIEDLRGHFTCDNCGTRIWHNGTPGHSRCKCGAKSFPPTAASE